MTKYKVSQKANLGRNMLANVLIFFVFNFIISAVYQLVIFLLVLIFV